MKWELQYLSSGIDGAREEVKVVVKQTKNWNIDFKKMIKYIFLGICANYDKWSLTRIETVYVIHGKVA